MKTHGQIAYARFDDGPLDGAPPVWIIRANADVMIRLKRLFPRASKFRTGTITLVDTPETCRDLEWVLDRWPLEIDDAARARLTSRADQHRSTEQTIHEILTGARPHLAFTEPSRPARDYQLVAADLVLTTGRLLLADDLGLGKSMSGILVLRNPDALPALVVCPTHLPGQWEEEIAKTLPWLRTHTVRTGKVYDPSKRRDAKGHDPDVLIVSYSKLRGWADHLAGRVRTVIFDEAQELRHAGSQKYVAAAQIADQAAYRMGLTATPIYNYGGEIHTLMQVLAPDALGSREEFIREWAGGSGLAEHPSLHHHVRVADPAALGVYLREQGLMLRRTRREVGRELPEVVRVPHTVEADEDTLERLTGDAVSLAELIVSRAAAREELFRAAGELDWKLRHATGVAKAPYVADFTRMLLESGEQVVLFGWHRDVYDIWLDRLADHQPVLYTGTESPAAKQRSRDAFVSGDARVLIMSLRSGAGLDGLQDVAHLAVFGELDWSPAMHDQCIGRLHRDGQDDPVVAYFLVSDHGADPVIADVLQLKRMQADPIRDPDTALFTPSNTTEDRVHRLALDVLNRARKQAA